LAHAGLVKSVPGSRAKLDRSPSQIELCFNERVELKFSTVGLTAPNGEKILLGALSLDERDPKCLRAAAPELKDAGAYTVNYRVLSSDGHVVDYGFTFSYQPNSR
jgi:methionine-rich copper-binding protein CopC